MKLFTNHEIHNRQMLLGGIQMSLDLLRSFLIHRSNTDLLSFCAVVKGGVGRWGTFFGMVKKYKKLQIFHYKVLTTVHDENVSFFFAYLPFSETDCPDSKGDLFVNYSHIYLLKCTKNKKGTNRIEKTGKFTGTFDRP